MSAPRPVPAAETRPRAAPALHDVSPRLLRCFVALGEELHFGRAADRLFVAQPALSRSIRRLERTLDRALFVRTTRTVALTASGAALLPAARDVLAALSAASDELATAHGRLRLAHVPCTDTVAVVLDQLAQRHPGLPVEERTLPAAEQLAAVRDGRLDVALCRSPVGDPALRSELVRLDPLLVAVIGRDPAVGRPVDLRRRRVAAPDGGPHERDFLAFVTAYEAAVGVRFRRVAAATGSGTEAYAMRRAGARAFLALASQDVRLDTACARVGAVPLQAYHPWSLVWRRTAPAAVRAVVAAAAEAAAARGWRDVTRLEGAPWLPGDAASSIAAA